MTDGDAAKWLTIGVLSFTAVGVLFVRCCATKRRVREHEENVRREQGVTLIVVTHDADLGRRAQRRIRLVDGRIDADVSD